jgi:UDP-N-acetylmuramoyl-L-alanyl-D-glutamate--2,6-diaminopimelate ligase
MDAYRDAKLQLFRGRCRLAVVNADDPLSADIAMSMPAGTMTSFGIDADNPDFSATGIVVDADRTRFTVHHDGDQYAGATPTPGRFAVSNALAAVAACQLLGHPVGAAVAALAGVPPAPGRLEPFRAPSGATIIVDYAHSPDALQQVLRTIRSFAADRRVITVFGCGGDRDRSKRRPMGEIAGSYSDLVVATSDNPRSEDPEAILDEIAAGIASTDAELRRVADRRSAIRCALEAAGKGDIVLVAGKGSEHYQILADRTIAFNDMETVRDLCAEVEPTLGR